ncbi:hypothetical protein SLS58_002822 [Diplodia intermedia]|uniref:Heterokaryon incompatibility domain-containing protein n=1 Tax=Diplodia intermedia TaxID=856260 RepID=A0ABR3TXR0_9PEZI
MANIYSSADLVIVVLDGDANTGIPRIQGRSGDIQKRIEINGSTLMNEFPKVETLISNSAWAKRGWTAKNTAEKKMS